MLKFDKSSVKLKKGRTYEEFVIAQNAVNTSYDKLCDYLKISFETAKAAYDRVYMLPIEKIGEVKRPKLQTLKTGTDWHKRAEARL